jgi:hypothetical protein
MGLSGVDAGHLVVAVALTYLLGFERDLRGAPTGDRVFALVGAGSGGNEDDAPIHVPAASDDPPSDQ